MGISLGAVFQAFSQSKRISWKSDDTIEGARIARSLLSDPSLIDAAIKEEKKEGAVEGEKGWRFLIATEPLELETGNDDNSVEIPSMLSLKLRLYHEGGQREKYFELTRWYRQ